MIELTDHYTKKIKQYDIMSNVDFILFNSSHINFISMQGDVKRAKITSFKTLKRKGIIRIGLKYGLYEYATIEYSIKDNSYNGVKLVKELTV